VLNLTGLDFSRQFRTRLSSTLSDFSSMKISLLQLFLLFIPAAFLVLLILDFRRSDEIEWREFSLVEFERTKEQKIPAIVLCLPDMFAAMKSGRLDEKKLSSEGGMSFVAYRHNYRYWTTSESYDERSPEDKWVLDNGGYKEPLLLLASRDGDLKGLWGLHFEDPIVTNEIIDYLDITGQRQSRLAMLSCLFGLSLAVMVALSLSTRRRRKSTTVK